MKKLTKFQTICLIILLAMVATMVDKTICQIYNANQQKHLYLLITTVAEISGHLMVQKIGVLEMDVH